MRTTRTAPLSKRPIVAALITASLGVTASSAVAGIDDESSLSPGAQSITVCQDPNPDLNVCVSDGSNNDGTLRYALMCGKEGTTVDLTNVSCTSFSVLKPIPVRANTLRVQGKGRQVQTITGDGNTNPIYHIGNGTLTIADLTIANGKTTNNTNVAGGGCINSNGSLTLSSVDVVNCTLIPGNGLLGRGGAIFARNLVSLSSSTVTNSRVGSSSVAGEQIGWGGGIFAESVKLTDSTVSGNTAGFGTTQAKGGGIFATAELNLYNSTIANNESLGNEGAAAADSITMFNSTITNNRADVNIGGVFVSSSAMVVASTLADNSAQGNGCSGLCTTSSAATLQSSILWHNTSSGISLDFSAASDTQTFGSNNLIGTSSPGSIAPADTISGDPLLGPLQNNGGPTFTRAPSAASPVIDRGNNNASALTDQRGQPRVSGNGADIGAVELDFVFHNGFERTVQ